MDRNETYEILSDLYDNMVCLENSKNYKSFSGSAYNTLYSVAGIAPLLIPFKPSIQMGVTASGLDRKMVGAIQNSMIEKVIDWVDDYNALPPGNKKDELGLRIATFINGFNHKNHIKALGYWDYIPQSIKTLASTQKSMRTKSRPKILRGKK